MCDTAAMPLVLEHPRAAPLAHDLATQLGLDVGEAVVAALESRLQQERERQATIRDVMAIAAHCASLPVLDDRPFDEILGYDENGLPS